jgi:hypothetical protein
MPWFVFVALTLTAYRATRLIVKDTFPPVLWLRDRLVGGWRPLTLQELELYTASGAKDSAALRLAWSYDPDDEDRLRYVSRAGWVPSWLAELFSCPWCASAYVSGALVAAVDITYGLPVPWLVGPAVWALSALLASKEWA